MYRVYKSGQQSMRVAVYGTKHDASLFEDLLKEASQFERLGTIGGSMIDTACLNAPKVRVHAYSNSAHRCDIAGFLSPNSPK